MSHEERRDKIARHYFDRVTPLDFFRVRRNSVEFDDLGIKYAVYPGIGTTYRVRLSGMDNNRSTLGDSRTGWIEIKDTSLPLTSTDVRQVLDGIDSGQVFLAIECQLNRGGGWSESVTAYYSPRSKRIVAMDR